MAFLAEAVEEIESENLKDIILKLLVSWLDRHRN